MKPMTTCGNKTNNEVRVGSRFLSVGFFWKEIVLFGYCTRIRGMENDAKEKAENLSRRTGNGFF